MPKGFISNFNIQHVTSCFVAGHFVAITSFYRSSGGIANKKTTTCFTGQTVSCYKMICFYFFLFLCYHVLSKQEQLQNGFTASPYKPTHSIKKTTLLQNGGPGCIFKTMFYL